MEFISPTDLAKEKVQTVQDYLLFSTQAVANLFRTPFYFGDMVRQADAIGVGSLPIVVLTGFFTGAVLALQASNTLERFGSITLVGTLVSTSMVRELGPVLTSLMVAGRNSSGMASELGSMMVTEQIDAMRALGTDPMKKLVTPRVVASVFMLFFLAIISDVVGLAGGLMVAKVLLRLDARQYWANAWQALVFQDVFMGLIKPVLFGVSFHLNRGETKAIFGVAGSGKSLLLKLALGLIRPDSGRIVVLGEDITQMREQDLFELRGKIGMVFQESALFDSMTVRENVAYRLTEEHGIYDEDIDRRVREALRFVELEHTLDLDPAELSGGMRRRVAIARAIITQPELLLYDSPTGGLDPVTSNTIIELIMKQRDVYHTSSLLVSHRLQDAFVMATHQFDKQTNQMHALPRGHYCDVPMSFLILRDGKVIFDGDLRHLARSKDEYIQEYIS